MGALSSFFATIIWTPTTGSITARVFLCRSSSAINSEAQSEDQSRSRTSKDKYTGRIDHKISEKARLFARWSQTFEFKGRTGAFFGPDNPAGTGEKAGNNRWDFGLGYNYTFSPTFLMSVNAGVNRWVETRVEQSFGFPPTKLGLPAFF